MYRTFCYPIYPTNDQISVLECWFDRLRLLFNGALQERKDAWRLLGKSISLYQQEKSLTEIRANDRDYAAISVHAERSVLKRVDRGMNQFFARRKAKKKAGPPRYKKFGNYNSFSFPFGKITVEGTNRSARLHIPNFGKVRINLYRPLKGEPIDVTVRRDSDGRWRAAIVCDLGAAPSQPNPKDITSEEVLGADVGITSLVAFSDGSILTNPRHFQKNAERLARRQRALKNKRKGSRSRARTQQLIAKTYQHIANQRRDYFRKSACDVVGRCKAIVFEDLNIDGLSRSILGKHINLAAWRLYRQIVTCKAEEAGKLVVLVDPRHTSQLCSECGASVPKELDERWHRCSQCGTSLDRDVNAARVIKARGVTTLGMSVVQESMKVETPGRRSKKTSPMAKTDCDQYPTRS
jgi:putative transposase